MLYICYICINATISVPYLVHLSAFIMLFSLLIMIILCYLFICFSITALAELEWVALINFCVSCIHSIAPNNTQKYIWMLVQSGEFNILMLSHLGKTKKLLNENCQSTHNAKFIWWQEYTKEIAICFQSHLRYKSLHFLLWKNVYTSLYFGLFSLSPPLSLCLSFHVCVILLVMWIFHHRLFICTHTVKISGICVWWLLGEFRILCHHVSIKEIRL